MLDRNGLTEEEFLKSYDASKYERPSCTADIFLYCPDKSAVLLVKRGGHPFIGKWAMPGGFLEPHETLEQAAARELYEETGVKISAVKQLRTFSAPDRDPRTRIVTTAFIAVADDMYSRAGDDADDARWFVIRREILAADSSSEQGRIRLSCEGEAIQFMYKKTNGAFPSDPVFTASGANRIAGDHAAIIACAADYLGIKSCTKTN